MTQISCPTSICFFLNKTFTHFSNTLKSFFVYKHLLMPWNSKRLSRFSVMDYLNIHDLTEARTELTCDSVHL